MVERKGGGPRATSSESPKPWLAPLGEAREELIGSRGEFLVALYTFLVEPSKECVEMNPLLVTVWRLLVEQDKIIREKVSPTKRKFGLPVVNELQEEAVRRWAEEFAGKQGIPEDFAKSVVNVLIERAREIQFSAGETPKRRRGTPKKETVVFSHS